MYSITLATIIADLAGYNRISFIFASWNHWYSIILFLLVFQPNHYYVPY